MKSVKFIALGSMIVSSAVFIKVMEIKPFFKEHPIVAFAIFVGSALVYRILDERRDA